jgi:predicted secreted Zn-dependent protease
VSLLEALVTRSATVSRKLSARDHSLANAGLPFAALLVVFFASSNPAFTAGPGPFLQKPDASINQSYYNIKGKTVADLRAQMFKLGPVDKFGRRCDGYTDWYIKWTFSCSRSAGAYSLSNIYVKVNIKHILPRWEKPTEPPDDLEERWARFSESLQVHEDGHKDIAMRAATEIIQALKDLRPHPACDEAHRSANQAAQAVLDKHRKTEREYDKSTNHGETQGARLR